MSPDTSQPQTARAMGANLAPYEPLVVSASLTLWRCPSCAALVQEGFLHVHDLAHLRRSLLDSYLRARAEHDGSPGVARADLPRTEEQRP